MTASFAAFLGLSLVALLFGVAAATERFGTSSRMGPKFRHGAYTLGLGVYCSSWTFYGAVGTAVSEGWNYLPIYLAPVFLLLAAPRFLERLSRAVQEERASTISDFIAARFGHDPGVARIITVIALCGTVPYIALQLRGMGTAIAALSGRDLAVPVMVTAAGGLSLFAILFGARRYEISGRSEGLVFSIALESVIKLVALGLVGAYAVYVLAKAGPADLGRAGSVLGEQFGPSHVTIETFTVALVSAFAVLVLPRQFYMGLAEAHSPRDLPRARFGLSLYLLVMAALIVPIALAGLAALPPGVAPDSFVLLLPAREGADAIAIAALLGGLSSGAAMVIVDATALSTMVSNDLIFPAVVRNEGAAGAGDLGRKMLVVRRLAIVGVVGLALAWALLVDPARSLASIGLVAFSAMVQFVPHLLLAVAAPGRDPVAARASLLTGLSLWLYTLALPPIMPAWLVSALQGTITDPSRLLGIGHASPLVHGVGWSLAANLAVLALAMARQSRAPRMPRLVLVDRAVGNLGDLAGLAARFIGEERALAAFPRERHANPVDRQSARLAQDLIGGVVGASSARALVASALAGGRMNLEDVTRLLDEGGQSLSFSRQLLAATFENLQSGVSVIDGELNLVAWNTRYVDLFGYPPGLVRVGVPIATLIRYNVERGDFAGTVEEEVEKRLRHLRARRSYASERVRRDGRVIKSVGGPMPGGGYLTSFTDITEEAAVRAELERTLDELEQRVNDRTSELSEANRRLADATREKTRFLAAASHDLLQPLHAARLFASALDRNLEGNAKVLAARVDRSIVAAEALLRALLDISKLDAGGIQPDPEPVPLAPLIADIAENMRPLAEEKGITLRIGSLVGTVDTDPGLLRSVLQNLVANAVRYTVEGGVIIGVRRRGAFLRIDVYDTGVGIPPDKQRDIFSEFTRLGSVEAEGLGLGLAIVERIARLIGARIEVRSVEGRGSRFSVLLPAAACSTDVPPDPNADKADVGGRPRGALKVLVVDNEPDIVEATVALLEGMGHHAIGAAGTAQALEKIHAVDVLLADYHLDGGEDGLRLIDQARSRNPTLATALITAESGADLRNRLRMRRVPLFVKPADPAAIEAFLAGVSGGEIEP
ncbi:multi-sensor hybrid histidine kinase [Novosphingobium aromaticivorans DSM 12444]|uniref:histidine kinase n=1 Tax=Novosphingobium aromaticivorans (strain ATCC 700278 / DSM 12444 / CCUG 56034 / CIP 105152 / NBRC 16084 / F199) TaxID=279238 RepID=Q2G510_NOVAD|nr:PAS domain-containing hybrid sensor histidine kinase/response regulator [Novosphingobium aromaticivorans]ABD27063.1 multi-sensor hybrid histidine kinase [Novosphingobium aromaticivorans DSM 12444]SCY49428.1 multi-sensor hybrid histidine kinase [Novosphingobium aromaticivorans]